ncbi:hypothetical protein EK21DRAFT_89697 [Setomelanomma holmii]|uniref:DUF7704 domain-containing protein n=1 Tax=Setomelanomma holmii TaxID=210430 RepID=A0A9P4LJV1_9PLEO|nr:hypothetical protein EK21DRAFT_89697 [Setomelanomma holmii]
MSNTSIHPFYHFYFTTFDPTTLLLTVLSCIFTPKSLLDLIVPTPARPLPPLEAALVYQTAGLYGFMGIMFAVLLRSTNDIKVWRIVEGATLAVDVSLLGVLLVVLDMQGRLGLGEWRASEIVNAGFVVWCVILRASFLMGVGVGEDKGDGSEWKKVV